MTRARAATLIVGDPSDPHVVAVSARLPAAGLVVVDALTLGIMFRQFSVDHTVLRDVTGTDVSLEADWPARGWVRRLAPAGWDNGVILGSHGAAVLSARLSLLGALLRDDRVQWVSRVDDLVAAENKLTQYRAARRLGHRVPDTLVPTDIADVQEELGAPFVLKPIGVGHYADADGTSRVAHARAVTSADLVDVDLTDAPFLAQRLLHAERHLRVVTVGGEAWVAELDATALPVDWRADDRAHVSFRPSQAWPDVCAAAVVLTNELRCGFSSQDWVVDKEGPAFLDLNPGGQWLFLPPEVTEPVADALADRLRSSC